MSSYPVKTLADPTLQNKMPLFDGLSKAESVPGLLSKQYGGAYLAYDPRGKDSTGFTPPWRPTKTSPLDDRSPVSHLSGMEARNHLIYRQDSTSLEEVRAQPSSVSHTPMRKGFMLYTKSPEISAPTVATVRKQKSEHSPPQTHLYLAIPKPVYGHNPCCSDLGCVMGQRYMEHLPPKMPNSVYEPDWMQTSAHYAEKTHIQRKEVLQQRSLQFDSSTEPKRIPVQAYSPSGPRTFPSVSEPTYSSYPCTPPRTLFTSLNEHSQPLHTIPGGYPSLYAPHPTYEHMTSDIYQERSPVPKYGQLAQRPVFYYAQANRELENRTLCKDGANKQRDAPLPQKHSIPSPLPHYIVPQSLHAEIPFSCTEILPNHSFIRGYDYPYFAVPRFHLNSSQMRTPLERSSPTLLSSRINISPPKDKPATSPHIDSSVPLVHSDHGRPASRGSQPAISPSRQPGRFFHPLAGLHRDAPTLSPAGASMDRHPESSSCRAQVMKQPRNLAVSPAGWMLQSPTSDETYAAAASGANGQKVIRSPTVTAGSNRLDAENLIGKRGLKRSISHSSPPVKIKEEDRDLYEVECSQKQQKVEKETGSKTDSPPMPVIDNVFSLAPYQLHLQASGVLFPGRVPKRATQTPEKHKDQTKRDGKEKMLEGEDAVLTSDTPDAAAFKVEKGDQSDSDPSVEICNDYSKQTIKKECVEAALSENGSVKEKAEFKTKCSTPGENESLAELKPAEPISPVDPSSDANVGKHLVTVQPKSSQSPQSTESKVDFRNIPPHFLKLSTYNIIIPGGKHRSTELEKLSPQPVTVLSPKPDLEMPVRKHFFELHHSLCKLISKSVSASLEENLKKWLFQMKVAEAACRTDKVKVSSLLGVKAREAWINEEIKSTLDRVLDRLREYTSQERCPFPHVMRTGAVFLPMLVMKELLFPMVQGSFIDQVLQEHKVELRPTTLSEEKILIQLHKRACSSKLRRLMSLKHLPDVYTDVVNLLYYTDVCKYLESPSPDDQKTVQVYLYFMLSHSFPTLLLFFSFRKQKAFLFTLQGKT
uniref:Uncharacterized protein n=1 Tax=Oryzias latipes TaxID=8090 RepID=A0A3P9LX01_ORYLA